MKKETVGAESNRKLPHIFIPSKTATLVPEFAVEDLPLDMNCSLGAWVYSERPAFGKTASLVPEFAVEDLPLGRTPTFVPEFSAKDLPLSKTL